jgi:hypothetical protein
MHFQRSNIPDLDICSPATIQAYLDGIAALSIRHGLVADFANLMPLYPEVGGYCLTGCGYLRVYTTGELADVAAIREQLRAASAASDTRPRTYISDFASLSGHERLRLLKDSR